MGTRGRYVFRYKKKYYIFYNHNDSYFDWLGDKIITELRAMTDADFEEFKALIDAIPSDFECDLDREGLDFKGLKEALIAYETAQDITSTRPCISADGYAVRYQYTVDLDNMRLEIMWDGGKRYYPSMHKFWIRGIPEDWKELCDEDEEM